MDRIAKEIQVEEENMEEKDQVIEEKENIKVQVRDLCYNSSNLYPNCIIKHMLTK